MDGAGSAFFVGFMSGFTYSQHGHLHSSFVFVTSHFGQIHEPSAIAPPHWNGASFAGAAALGAEADIDDDDDDEEEETDVRCTTGSKADGAVNAVSLMTKV